MSPPRSRSRSARPAAPALVAGALVALALAAPASAWAQACCAGGMVLTPGRLQEHETALVGVQVKATAITGSFGPDARFVRSPSGSGEGDFEQDLIATLRVLDRGQFSVMLPLVETYRRDPGISDSGGGVGDMQVNARWDAVLTGSSVYIPGIAVLASMILPTGLPPELATHQLAADSTGTGTVQGALGVAVEQTFGDWLVNVTGSATLHSARTVSGIHTQLGPSFNAAAAVGYSFHAGPVAAVTASYTGSRDSTLDGVTEPASARTQLRFGLAGGYALADHWRLQGGVFGDLPVTYFGQNQPAGAGLSATLFRTW